MIDIEGAYNVIKDICKIVGRCWTKKRKASIVNTGNDKAKIVEGDLLDIAFRQQHDEMINVVIPVNTDFDVIVDSDTGSVEKPIVSPKSVHGKWIQQMLESGVSLDELRERIAKGKKLFLGTPKKVEGKTRGETERFPLGSCITIKGKPKVQFILLALSEFDENNNAQCPREEYNEIVRKLIDYNDKRGNGYDLYLPLIGTKLSRVDIPEEEAKERLLQIFQVEKSKIHCDVYVVAFKQLNKN